MYYGTTEDGKTVERFELGERGGPLVVDIVTYGATITGVYVPDRSGEPDNVVLHYDSLQAYEHQPQQRAYYGATIGRYANRIANGLFALRGTEHAVVANDGPHTLHGGARGFDAVVWEIEAATPHEVVLSHKSPHGDQGFPGNLDVRVRFSVKGETLRIEYAAISDADTVINLTNHSYFNLSPRSHATAAEHVLQIFADAYTPVDDEQIPTGEIEPVEGTRYDFRAPRTIGPEPYDSNWVLPESAAMRPALLLGHPAAGRMLEVLTSEPGVQVYSQNSGGVAIETQHFADSPNHPDFPSTVLPAARPFASATQYRFLRT